MLKEKKLKNFPSEAYDSYFCTKGEFGQSVIKQPSAAFVVATHPKCTSWTKDEEGWGFTPDLHQHRQRRFAHNQVEKLLAWNQYANVVFFAQNSYIQIDIGNIRLSIPSELKDITNQIEEAKAILELEDNWDDEGAIATDHQTFLNAVQFVLTIAIKLLEDYGAIVETPYIDIMSDGAVSIHWETNRSQFLIIFKKNNNPLAYFYGKSKVTQIPYKSAILINMPVDETLILWMKTNLT